MHTYIRLFVTLLLPLTLLFTVVSIGYFNLDYSFTKAFKLGVLSGVFIGISVSFLIAFILLILRKMKKVDTTRVYDQKKTRPLNETTVETKASQQIPGIEEEIKFMVLMDSELIFDVLINAIKKEKEHYIVQSDPQAGIITIQTKKGIIKTTITSLTQHTSELVLLTQNNITEITKLIAYVKEKEHSFLQY